MFDKLIESNSAEAEFKPRRKFFMVSSVVVGIMFLSAVMISLYAQDLDLGTDEFDLSAIMAPVPPDAPEPEPPRQQSEQSSTESADVPSRPELIAQLDRNTEIPDAISTTPNKIRAIPDGPVQIGEDTGKDLHANRPVGDTPGTGLAENTEPTETEVVKVTPPPPPIERREPPRTKTEGVINGKATYLPNPPYPRPAQMVGAYGPVNVQVTIDEDGKVISSKAVSGHPLLRQTAESAAWKARFSPTYLSRVPVKVTGVIVFNFRKN